MKRLELKADLRKRMLLLRMPILFATGTPTLVTKLLLYPAHIIYPTD
jgi:hypothetical protein